MKKTLFCLLLGIAGVSLCAAGSMAYAGVDAAEENSCPLQMTKGASMRIAGNAAEAGIRWQITMEKATYDTLESESVSYGVLIVPYDWVDEEGEPQLTAETVFGTGEEKVYTWAGDTVDGGDYKTIINLTTDALVAAESGDYCYYNASIVKILPGNYTRKFIAVGYVKTESETGVTYRFAENNDNARSVAEVAQMAYDDDTSENKPSDDQKTNLKDWYLTPATQGAQFNSVGESETELMFSWTGVKGVDGYQIVRISDNAIVAETNGGETTAVVAKDENYVKGAEYGLKVVFGENAVSEFVDISAATEVCTVTFRQDGQEDVIRIVKKGESLVDVPEPVSVPGCILSWSVSDFDAIEEDMVVNARVQLATPEAEAQKSAKMLDEIKITLPASEYVSGYYVVINGDTEQAFTVPYEENAVLYMTAYADKLQLGDNIVSITAISSDPDVEDSAAVTVGINYMGFLYLRDKEGKLTLAEEGGETVLKYEKAVGSSNWEDVGSYWISYNNVQGGFAVSGVKYLEMEIKLVSGNMLNVFYDCPKGEEINNAKADIAVGAMSPYLVNENGERGTLAAGEWITLRIPLKTTNAEAAYRNFTMGPRTDDTSEPATLLIKNIRYEKGEYTEPAMPMIPYDIQLNASHTATTTLTDVTEGELTGWKKFTTDQFVWMNSLALINAEKTEIYDIGAGYISMKVRFDGNVKEIMYYDNMFKANVVHSESWMIGTEKTDGSWLTFYDEQGQKVTKIEADTTYTLVIKVGQTSWVGWGDLRIQLGPIATGTACSMYFTEAQLHLTHPFE